ncbi:MAG: penicillin acylase family protein [Deltaproteobacteria bacterium]|nr:penicillin acylase family protein [Deltaproteobacteria bacterium]
MQAMRTLRWLLAVCPALVLSCTDSPTPPADSGADASALDASSDLGADGPATADANDSGLPSAFPTVAVTERWDIPGLTGEVHILRTAGNVPHLYARNRVDLARAHGFVVARDRFFFLDLARRYGTGRLAALLGDAALRTDQQNLGVGMGFVTDNILRLLSPEQRAVFQGFADGINAYIAQAQDGALLSPSEYTLAAPLLGRRRASDLLENFTVRDVAAMNTTFLYQSGFETDDVGRDRAARNLPGDFTGQALADLRAAGVFPELWNPLRQPAASRSADGWGLETATGTMAIARPAAPPRDQRPDAHPGAASMAVPLPALDRLASNLGEIQARLMRDQEVGYGSNSWAVMGSRTRDGSTLLAADGHLPLTIPALFYQIGLDTQTLGGGDIHQMGIALTFLPATAMGTNGRVAWGFTQLGGDITDWYREELVLDASGRPSGTRFRGAVRPLTVTEETVGVANVPALMSVGRTERWSRYVTFDGRWINQIEGRRVRPTDPTAPGEVRVQLLGDVVVPGDTDGDGVITAVSFDYVGLDGGNAFRAYDGYGKARNVREFREASRSMLATSLNQVAADADGSIYYAGWQAVPCREYLPREADRSWRVGANPRRLLDGTTYGGFHIPLRDGVIDESMGAVDPYQCVVPLDRTPAALDPARGYVMTANNEPGNITGDDSVTNDPVYIGGPWHDGFRGARIDTVLTAGVAARTLDGDAMATLQADSRSNLGEVLVPALLDAIASARTAAAATPAAGSPEARLAAAWRAHQADYESVERRLTAWRTAGFPAHSGVETFYHSLVPNERELSVATSIHNAWMGRFFNGVFGDERLPDGVFDNGGGGSVGRVRAMLRMLRGRGAGNPEMLASYNPATQESAYFDVLGTEAVETSREVALTALDAALTFLRAAPSAPGRGGYGTNDMDQWVWGLRHHVNFESILSTFLDGGSSLGALVSGFSITPARIPLAMNLAPTDPRANLPGFPRPGDQWGVDAANSGFGGESFTFGSGPTYRMVVALRRGMPDAMEGRNVIPGGQSGLNNSEFYDDQARLWLGNRALPMLLSADAVVAAATGHEVLVPAPVRSGGTD